MKSEFRQKADTLFFQNSSPSEPSEYPLRALMACAVALPMMCAYQQPPQPAFFTQALSIALWSGALFVLAFSTRAPLRRGNSHVDRSRRVQLFSVIALWTLLLMTLVAHVALGLTPLFIAAPIALNLALALCLSLVVAFLSPSPARLERWLRALLLGVLIAALFNAVVALLQTVAPHWTDDVWVARIVAPSARAGGNLRQPNQLATLMLWGLLATSFFWRQRPWLWIAFSVPLLATLLATESRTGMVGLSFIAVVAMLRSRRVRAWRAKGWLALLVTLVPLAWFAENIFTRSTANAAMSLRVALWRDVVEIISQQPWLGVGWGQLNFVWTLTPLPARAADVFDHAHSLPLHLAAELGLPITLLVLALLCASLWCARAAMQSRLGIAAALLLATVLLHSLIEYPLWFSYFLLPSAFFLAWLGAADSCAGAAADEWPTPSPRNWLGFALKVAAVTTLTAVIYGGHEYGKAASIHRVADQPDALDRAIVRARGSPLYGNFGDYAAIMLAGDAATASLFIRPIRHVLDERLLGAYARMLARSGDTTRAAYVVERAREFPADPAFANLPSIVAPPNSAKPLTARDFRR